MSELLEIQNQLDVANRRVAALERSLVDHPEYPSIAANLESARRIKQKLELQFAEASARENGASKQCGTVANVSK